MGNIPVVKGISRLNEKDANSAFPADALAESRVKYRIISVASIPMIGPPFDPMPSGACAAILPALERSG
jgi:hypothetical protein